MRLSLRMSVALLLAAALLAAPAGASAAPSPSDRGEARAGWLAALRSFLAPIQSLWAAEEEGPMMDPSGVQPPPSPADSEEPSGTEGDEGPMMDPSG